MKRRGEYLPAAHGHRPLLPRMFHAGEYLDRRSCLLHGRSADEHRVQRPVGGGRLVAGECPECGEEALQAYPVLSEGGWWDVTKCQQCLCSVKREPGPLLGGIQLLIDAV